MTVSYCDVEGGKEAVYVDLSRGCTLDWSDPTNINATPLFVSASDLHLQSGSPCIDAGSNDADPATPGHQSLVGVDADLKVRVVASRTPSPIVDMGAYEFGSAPVPDRLYVKHDAAGAGVGTSWVDAFVDLQMAMRTAVVVGGQV